MSNRLILSKPSQLAALALFLLVGCNFASAAVDKVTSSTQLTLDTPSRAYPVETLLDVGIPTLNDGLYLTDEDDTVFPEVRYAEAIYFSNQRNGHQRILSKTEHLGIYFV